MTRSLVGGLECHEMSPDGRVVALARRSEGIVTSAQLMDAGLTPKAVAHRVKTGWLVRWHRGVFLVGPLEVPLSRPRAAVLAVGEGAVLSHHAAAALWEFPAVRPGAIDVTLPGCSARNRPGIRIHRVRDLHPADVTRRRDLPLTSPARTLLSPRDWHPATSHAPSRPPRYSGGSHLIPSMSSSRATPTTGEGQRCDNRHERTRTSPAQKPSAACSG